MARVSFGRHYWDEHQQRELSEAMRKKPKAKRP